MKKYFLLFALLMLRLAQAQTWTSTDVGAVGKPGTDSYNSTTGTYTLAGCGADIWNTSDAFHFVYQTIPGDGELTARVVSVQGTNVWAKAGIMIRQDATPGAINGFTAVTPGNGVTVQYRTTTGGSTSYTNTTGLVAPYWVKMVRDGSILTSYQSPDGVHWTLNNFTQLPFTGPVDIGLGVCSHTTTALCTATFDNINLITSPTFAGPMPWLDQDIGAVYPTETGALHYENNLWNVYGSGADIWNTADAFHLVYEPLQGDGQVIAQVLSQVNTSTWAKAGVTIRQDLTPGSPHVSLYVTP